ncbi:MAG TPA: M28 family metallopeptidase [Terriglobales bacterium]|nr:M28 family metallopeptidase [Terriglobales bacterium]
MLVRPSPRRDSARTFFAGLLVVILLAAGATAQTAPASRPARKPEVDPHIAAALKAVSAAQIKANIVKLVSFYNRSTLSPATPEAIQSGRGIGAAREWIKSEFERYSKECGGCLEVKTDSYMQEPGERVKTPTEIVDVYAVLKGTDEANAGRIVLVTGHYDSRNSDNFNTDLEAPGANDDGSGTAVSLECARVLSKHKFPATIIFLTVAGEEQGLYGSKHFAEVAKQEKWDLQAVLNNDIVGGNKTPGDKLQDPSIVRVFSEGVPDAADDKALRQLRNLGGENDSSSRELARYIRETAKLYLTGPFGPKLIFRRDRYLRGGDHTSFNQFGFAAVRFTEYREDFNHQHQNVRTENGIEYGDLPKFVDFDYVANVARLNAATLASLASAPAPPANVRLLTKGLENDSTLTWEASPGGLATGYEVVWRATTAPYWENVVPVGNVTRYTLKQSKDNVIFAVRAVDNGGHRSLPVVPLPER